MDKKLFDDAIGEVPPSTVDVEAAIARGRRAARFRSVGAPVVGVATAVVLAVGAVAFLVMPDSPPSSAANPGPTSAPPPPSPAPSDGGCRASDLVPPSDEPPGAAKTRLTDLARDLVGPRLPAGATLTGDEEAGPLVFSQPNTSLTSEEDLKFINCDPGRFFEYNALADIESADGKSGLLHVTISARTPGPMDPCPTNEKLTDQPVCEATTGPGGERIQSRTDVLNNSWVENFVLVHKPDGTFITISSAKGSVVGGKPNWPEPPLNHQQLREIALDPGMTLFP